MLVFTLCACNSEWLFLVVSKMFKTETISFVKTSYFMAKAMSLTKTLSMIVCLGEGTGAIFNKNTFLAR